KKDSPFCFHSSTCLHHLTVSWWKNVAALYESYSGTICEVVLRAHLPLCHPLLYTCHSHKPRLLFLIRASWQHRTPEHSHASLHPKKALFIWMLNFLDLPTQFVSFVT